MVARGAAAAVTAVLACVSSCHCHCCCCCVRFAWVAGASSLERSIESPFLPSFCCSVAQPKAARSLCFRVERIVVILRAVVCRGARCAWKSIEAWRLVGWAKVIVCGCDRKDTRDTVL